MSTVSKAYSFHKFTERETYDCHEAVNADKRTIFTGCLTIINSQVSALVGKDNEVVIQKLYLVLECTIHVFLLTSPLHSELCCVTEG